jgi:hypothetical protein
MADALGPRLRQLQELSKKLNSTADDVSKIVQSVESFLSDVCRLGIEASIVFHKEEFEPGEFLSQKVLCYGRYAKAYRLYVVEETFHMGTLESRSETLWANCPRDLKLTSYIRLPELLDDLIHRVQITLDMVEQNSEAVLALVPPVRSNKKEATS